MRTFTNAAVFGLVPVPPMPATGACSDSHSFGDSDIRPVPTEDVSIPQPACPRRDDATERMATKDELARIRRQLEDVRAGLSGDRKTA
jgi:hypothetical protein